MFVFLVNWFLHNFGTTPILKINAFQFLPIFQSDQFLNKIFFKKQLRKVFFLRGLKTNFNLKKNSLHLLKENIAQKFDFY